MKFAVSNIALPEYDHAAELDRLAEIGIEGLEVAPSRVWRDWYKGLVPGDVDAYRRRVEAAGLRVIGLHSMFWKQETLGLFRDRETTGRTADYLVHLSRLCADLGGHTLVFGSGGARRRGALSADAAAREAAEFFIALAPRIADHGTCFAFEPLGPDDSDFINSVREAVGLVDAVDSPVLRTHLDAKALVQADEINPAIFDLARPTMAHFHANQLDLGVLRDDGGVDHRAIGIQLRRIGYDGYVSIEQRQVSADAPLADIARSAAILKEFYA